MKIVALDDRLTLAAHGVLAFTLANVSHEGLGHGLATLAVGGKAVFLCTCYFDSSGPFSRWIPAAGGLMNVAVGLGALAVLRLILRLDAGLRYFLVLVAAFNLFFAFGYPAYSGVAKFGDWAAVTSGLQPLWVWRVLLVVVSVGGYYGSLRLIGGAIAPFAGSAGEQAGAARLRRITLVPYVAAIVVAGMAGALNPRGLMTMLTSGIPAAAAAYGLTQMDHFVGSGWGKAGVEAAAPLRRSYPWIVAGVVVLIFFVGVLGRGIRFS